MWERPTVLTPLGGKDLGSMKGWEQGQAHHASLKTSLLCGPSDDLACPGNQSLPRDLPALPHTSWGPGTTLSWPLRSSVPRAQTKFCGWRVDRWWTVVSYRAWKNALLWSGMLKRAEFYLCCGIKNRWDINWSIEGSFGGYRQSHLKNLVSMLFN